MQTLTAARASLEDFRRGTFTSGAKLLEELFAATARSAVTASATLQASGLAVPQLVIVNAAAGLTLTLPAATGSGAMFRIVLGTTVTSNTVVVKVADATDTMAGQAWVAQDGGDTVVAFEAGATADTITLNGTTTGGFKGDMIELVDIAADQWAVQVRMAATGVEATPFSATV